MPVNRSINSARYRLTPLGDNFDTAGAVHYTHADYQGSIIAVTDSAGTVVQTTNYYPYGEPSGQPMLFSGKERTTLSDYHFDPRSYNAAGIFWHAADLKASEFTSYSPYSYCLKKLIVLKQQKSRDAKLREAFKNEANLDYSLSGHNCVDPVVNTSQQAGLRAMAIPYVESILNYPINLCPISSPGNTYFL